MTCEVVETIGTFVGREREAHVDFVVFLDAAVDGVDVAAGSGRQGIDFRRSGADRPASRRPIVRFGAVGDFSVPAVRVTRFRSEKYRFKREFAAKTECSADLLLGGAMFALKSKQVQLS